MDDQAVSEENRNHSRLLSTRQAAEEYRVSPRKLRRHLREEEIDGAYKDSSGHWCIPEYSLQRFLSQVDTDQKGVIEGVLDYWSLVQSRPPLRLAALLIGFFVIVATIVGFLVDLPELVAGFIPDRLETPLSVEVSALPTPIPALPTGIIELISGAQVLTYASVDLDGDSVDEFVVSWKPDSLGKVTVSVFGYDTNNGWQSLLQLNQIWETCPFTSIYYEGSINLFHDSTRQIVLSSGCGTGTLMVYFEVYQYNELGLMERIFPKGGYEWASELLGLESSMQRIEIVEDKLFVYTQLGLYRCFWANNALSCSELEIDTGPNLVAIDYWVDAEGNVQVSQDRVTLEVGQYLSIKSQAPEDAQPIRFKHNGVLQMRADYFYAAQTGENRIILGYGPMRGIDIKVIGFGETPD